jgi:hypothetical protein
VVWPGKDYRQILNVLVTIPVDHYNSLMMACVPFRSTYLLLKNGPVIRDNNGRQAVEILCDSDEADGLRELASQICPDAALDIAESIRLARAT